MSEGPRVGKDNKKDLETLRSLDTRQSGMLPCFLVGFLSRLVSSVESAAMSFARVCLGRITSSTKPREAAMYGLANFP